MKKRIRNTILLCLSILSLCPALAQDLPQMKRNGKATQLMVDGKPFIILGGELHNSSSSNLTYLNPLWEPLKKMNLNTVLVAVSWELIDHQFFKAYVTLTDKSFTTSGNYFNYREENGVRYSHTIDPVTGYPARRAILSASVFSSDCTTADTWGTALMVMGHEKAMEVLKDHPEIDVLLIYSTPGGKSETYVTPGATSYIRIEPNK